MQMKKIIYLGFLGLITSCSIKGKVVKTNLIDHQTFKLTEISTNPSYGLSKKNPIQVGGVDRSEGPLNERRYLNALLGPNGEQVFYSRLGSCCPTKSKNDPYGFGSVVLDIYQVVWEGSNDTISIYLNMYDYGVLMAPVGFTIKE